jgi:uncharacterized membrane protein
MKTKSSVTPWMQAPERLAAFSDGVFAVIITIMVLELRPPTVTTLSGLLPLWPTFLSYLVSYVFIAIVWVNHHHLLAFAHTATDRLIWTNFAHLFMVSLVPFSTAWIAASKLAAAPVFIYAAVFVLVNAAFLAFETEALSQAGDEISPRTKRSKKIRSLSTLTAFAAAMLFSFWSPVVAFALVCSVLLVYLRPHGAGRTGSILAAQR